MSVLFYGKPLDGGEWMMSESIWHKDGRVFLLANGMWYEVDPETEFYVER